MIAIIARAGDRVARAVAAELTATGAAFAWIDPRMIQRLTAHPGSRALTGLRCDGTRFRLADVTSAYSRAGAPSERAQMSVYGALATWLDTTPARVITRPRQAGSNASKPYQLQLIGRQFRVPETLVTNEPSLVETFARTYRRVIYKSMSSTRSVVREWDRNETARLERIRECPVQFQRYVPGVDYRVHVVGNDVFVARIMTSATDYRYAGRWHTDRKISTATLPKPVLNRCLALARQLDLAICGIDLRLEADSEFTCFEVNPSPAFLLFDPDGKQGIAAAVARLLS